jgi:hypothetical protein
MLETVQIEERMQKTMLTEEKPVILQKDVRTPHQVPPPSIG